MKIVAVLTDHQGGFDSSRAPGNLPARGKNANARRGIKQACSNRFFASRDLRTSSRYCNTLRLNWPILPGVTAPYKENK